MPFNFDKISQSKSNKRITDPIQLFQNLKIKDSAINDLWLAQGDALREWNNKRMSEDIAIALNTGAGKTLVGLIISQSIVNEIQEHILYVCSSIQLVEQTARKAEKYGIEVTTYFNGDFSNDLYERCLAPCITTYQAVFNGKSRFLKDHPKALIFDDAHTAEHLLREQFTLSKIIRSIVMYFLKYFNFFVNIINKLDMRLVI